MRPDNGTKSLDIAERIFFDAISYAKFRALYHRSKVRIMIDVSDNSEYSHRRIIIAVQSTNGGTGSFLKKSKEILLPRPVFFIPQNSIKNILGQSSDDKYFWDNCLFSDDGKPLTVAFRDIDAIGKPVEFSLVRPIIYALGIGSCNVNAFNKFQVKFLKNTQVRGGVLLPSGTIITLDSRDKITKLL
ncbi:MAG: hypothetical protein LBI37_01800 [Puniceicoccales bacterium]|nr:hypothetical protein [Puniceicoccales bacterium]